MATGVLILEKSSASTFRRIERALCFLDIAILVNAPGYGPAYPRPERFLDIPSRDAIFSSVSNNIMTITQMCAVVSSATEKNIYQRHLPLITDLWKIVFVIAISAQ